MAAKAMFVIFGIVLAIVNIIATLLAFNISFSFLSFLPNNMMIFTIISGILGIIMIIMGINPNFY